LAGRYDAAIEQCRKTLEMDRDFGPARTFLAEALLSKGGQYEEALGELQARERLWGENSFVLTQRGRAFALMGRRVDALKIIDRLRALSRDRYIPPSQLALIYASLRENKLALDWLEEAIDQQDLLLGFMNVEPAYKELHSDPRFVQLLRRIRLADKSSERDHAIHSVAVLPFKNVGGDPKTEPLSDGVAYQIIDNLSQVRRKDLIVRPFTSVARYRGKDLDIENMQKFGRELKVQMLVTGTLSQDGDKLSIRVEVVDVEQESHIWGRTYSDKPRDKILDLQDEIARDVAANLRLQLTGEEAKRLTKRYTEDPEAYLYYREATYHFNKVTPTGMDISIDFCRKALEKDRNYALAYFGLGRCYIILGAIYRGWRDNDYYAKAKDNLKQALAIDDTLAEAHSGLGMLYMYHDWNWAEAERELAKGAELDPNSAATQGLYGYYLAAKDKLSDALPLFRRACELNPLNTNDWRALARCHTWLRDHDQAITEATRALRLDPDHPLAHMELAEAYVHNRMTPKAIEHLQRAIDRGQQSPQVRSMLGYAYAVAGNRDEAQKVLEKLEALAPDQFGLAYLIACIYAALDDKDQAFEWLGKARFAREFRLIWIKVDPKMNNLRKDPEFAKVLKEMGLPP
jgi:tetratricopeptide (TPR) repeat protein